ncbi:hypothetical protein GCM10010096_25700 [Alcaligenes pakistanensis]|uniref:Uncharacterized protein n=1 Tax=Alcaligenes pakistanensis TaxID=1482717 RepID=A0A8H9IR84_9BURK|nr:hypothetical protein GCM10010096_25700 [Alcaligenes pakistanensis]
MGLPLGLRLLQQVQLALVRAQPRQPRQPHWLRLVGVPLPPGGLGWLEASLPWPPRPPLPPPLQVRLLWLVPL